jgi:hypothetical protein
MNVCCAHSKIERYEWLAQTRSEDSPTISLFKQMVTSGKIDGEEFLKLVKSETMTRGSEVLGLKQNHGRYGSAFANKKVGRLSNVSGTSEEENEKKGIGNSAMSYLAKKWIKRTRKSKNEKTLDLLGEAAGIDDRSYDDENDDDEFDTASPQSPNIKSVAPMNVRDDNPGIYRVLTLLKNKSPSSANSSTVTTPGSPNKFRRTSLSPAPSINKQTDSESDSRRLKLSKYFNSFDSSIPDNHAHVSLTPISVSDTGIANLSVKEGDS